MKRLLFFIMVTLFSLYACVSQKKYKEQVSQVDKQKERINEITHQYASRFDSLNFYLNSSLERQKDLENQYREFLQGNPILEESKTDKFKDTDGDQVPDIYDKCPQIAGTINNDGCPESKVEIKQNTTIVVQKPGNLTDINIGRAIQSYVSIPQCPDSVEIKNFTFLQIMLDFTGKEDSIDIDIRTVASYYSDTANIKTIKKRILKTDLGFIAEYMKIEVNYDKTGHLKIIPESGTEEFFKVSTLFNKKHIYKWTISCETPGTYAYSVHVLWYNNDKSFIKDMPITTCPGKILAYEKPQTILSKVGDVIIDNLWKGFAGAIIFILGFAGQRVWSKITTA